MLRQQQPMLAAPLAVIPSTEILCRNFQRAARPLLVSSRASRSTIDLERRLCRKFDFSASVASGPALGKARNVIKLVLACQLPAGRINRPFSRNVNCRNMELHSFAKLFISAKGRF